MALKRVSVFNPVTRQISETITIYSDKKIQFRDTGVYIQSSADGKLKFSADGGGADDFIFSGSVTFENDIKIDGSMVFGSASVDTLTINGTATIASDNKFYFRDTGLYLYSSANGQLDAIADVKLQLKAPTIDLEASTGIVLDGDVTIDGAHTFGTGTGAVSINGDATWATDKSAIFRAAANYINSPSADNLKIVSPTVEIESSTSILLDGDVSIDGAHTLSTGTGAISLNGSVVLATTKTYTSGTGSAIGGTHIIYQDGAGAKSFEVIPGTKVDLTETNINLTGAIKLDGAVTLDDDGTIEDVSDVMTLTQDTITLAGATAINLNGITNFSTTVNHGTFASPTTIIKDVSLIMVSGNVATDQTSGVTRCAWFRTKVSIAQTTCSVLGIEAQCRLDNPATLGAGQFTGIWAYWEQSGTTALNTGNLSSAASCTVESAATLTIDSGAILAGVVIDSSVNGSATNNGTFDAMYVKKAGSALDFVYMIEATDCISGAIFKFADDQTICSDDNQSILVNISGTANAGFIKVVVGSTDKYIALYDLKSS